MTKRVQIVGFTTAITAAFTGLVREITVDTDKKTVVVHDGSIAGGYPLARPGLAQTWTAAQIFAAITCTTLAASSTVSGAGFTAFMASPPNLGSTAPATVNGTTISATGAITAATAQAVRPQISGNGTAATLLATGATNGSWWLSSAGNGSIDLYTDTLGGLQGRFLHVASAARCITFAGSVAGNPTLDVTAGSLAITPATIFANSATATAFIPSNATVPTNGLYLSAANTPALAASTTKVLAWTSSVITATPYTTFTAGVAIGNTTSQSGGLTVSSSWTANLANAMGFDFQSGTAAYLRIQGPDASNHNVFAIRSYKSDGSGTRTLLTFAAAAGAATFVDAVTVSGALSSIGTASLATGSAAYFTATGHASDPVFSSVNGTLTLNGSNGYISFNGASARQGLLDNGNNWNFGPSGGELFQIVYVASANRKFVFTASNGGNPTLSVSAGNMAIAAAIQLVSTIGTTAGGALAFTLGSTQPLGVYFGSGAPSISAGKGSIYLRTDGTGIADRIYVNTNGSTTWTNLVSAA